MTILERFQIFEQARKLRTFFVALYWFPLLVLFTAALVHRWKGISLLWMMRDPADLANLHPLTGFISNLGILFWSASAAVCVFAWRVLRPSDGPAEFSTFLLCSAVFTTILMMDDLFQLHESL